MTDTTFPLERAIAIASLAHRGQVDKGGFPYIFHPLRVMLALDDPEDQILGVLHDTLEDTHLTPEYFRRRGLDPRLITTLELLTRHPRQDYMNYIHGIRLNDQATRVKLADLADNMDTSREILNEDYEKTHARQMKYYQAKQYLLGQN